ncbi:hypothetical protein RRG08_037453 [Elysia crispata]|uniref:Uncharacterized protein n=1 Tax=Elysia crispata TaxID=231223 RepID=A0AAE0Y463_9GAST|nr:hypothetical protein RRG08_037453 [Elysia crispata]
MNEQDRRGRTYQSQYILFQSNCPFRCHMETFENGRPDLGSILLLRAKPALSFTYALRRAICGGLERAEKKTTVLVWLARVACHTVDAAVHRAIYSSGAVGPHSAIYIRLLSPLGAILQQGRCSFYPM